MRIGSSDYSSDEAVEHEWSVTLEGGAVPKVRRTMRHDGWPRVYEAIAATSPSRPARACTAAACAACTHAAVLAGRPTLIYWRIREVEHSPPARIGRGRVGYPGLLQEQACGSGVARTHAAASSRTLTSHCVSSTRCRATFWLRSRSAWTSPPTFCSQASYFSIGS